LIIAVPRSYVAPALAPPSSCAGGHIAPSLDSAKRLLDYEHRPALKTACLRLALVNHELRHTAAAAWLSQGNGLEYVRRQMGHKSITTTIRNYGHLEPSMNPDAADRTAAALGLSVTIS
jgi:integrase